MSTTAASPRQGDTHTPKPALIKQGRVRAQEAFCRGGGTGRSQHVGLSVRGCRRAVSCDGERVGRLCPGDTDTATLERLA